MLNKVMNIEVLMLLVLFHSFYTFITIVTNPLIRIASVITFVPHLLSQQAKSGSGNPQSQNEAKCKTYLVKMSFIEFLCKAIFRPVISHLVSICQ